MNKLLLTILFVLVSLITLANVSAVGWVTDLSPGGGIGGGITIVGNVTQNITQYITLYNVTQNNTYYVYNNSIVNITNNITIYNGSVVNITYNDTKWIESTNIAGRVTLHPKNLTPNVGIGTNNSGYDLEVRNTDGIDVDGDYSNNTWLAISSGAGNDNATLLFREATAVRYSIFYDGFKSIFQIYSYALGQNVLSFNVAGDAEFSQNVNIIGDLTAPNICYSNGSNCNTTIGSTYNSSYVPYTGATADVNIGAHNFITNRSVQWLEQTGIQNLFYINPLTGDGFKMEYWYDFELANDDWWVFHKTDGNDATPDGGIAFMLGNASGYNKTIIKFDGYGNSNFTDQNISTTGQIRASWLFGLFDIKIDPASASWLQFNGSTLSFNFSNLIFVQGTVGNTRGAIINSIDNHTANSNNIIFAILGNGTSNVMMPHFWIQNGAGSQASGVSRSFMIVNENPTQQNTTNITSCVEYARYANKTLYIDCNTTTTGADLLVGDDAQIMGDAYTGNLNVTGLMTTENILVHGNVSIKRPYGSWSSTETQIMGSANTVYPITFNYTDESYQIVKEGNTNFTVEHTGQYFVSISAIFDTDSPSRHVELWIQYYNFTTGVWNNVPRSNTRMLLPSASTESVLVVSFIMPATPQDKFRISMATDDAGSRLLYITNTSYSPETPSIIMVAHKVSELTNGY